MERLIAQQYLTGDNVKRIRTESNSKSDSFATCQHKRKMAHTQPLPELSTRSRFYPIS
jgi:hypothetical protein